MVSQLQSTQLHRPRLATGLALTMFVIVGTSYSLNAMDRQVFSVLLPQIREEYSFGLSTGGLLATIFGLGVGAGALVAGFLADRYSRKWVMIAGILIYSLFTFLIPLAHGFISMAVYRTVSGIGEGLQQAALYAAVGAYYSSRRATALGALNFGFGSGTVLGPVLGVLIFASTGSWEVPFFIFGAVGFVFIGLIAIVVPRNFTDQVGSTTYAIPEQEDARSQTRQLLNPTVVWVLASAGTAGLAAFGWIAVFPTFVREELGFSTVQGGYVIAAFGVGALVAGFLGGALGDRYDQRRVIAGGLVASAVLAVLLFNVTVSPLTVYAAAFGLGAMLSGFAFVNLYALAQKSVPNHMTGRVSGVFVFTYYSFVALSGYLIGLLVELGGWDLSLWIQMVLVPLVGALMIFAARTSRSPAEL
jgi:MFS family permease